MATLLDAAPPGGYMMAVPMRQASGWSAAPSAGEAGEQRQHYRRRRKEGSEPPAVLGCPAAGDQQQIGGDHPPHDRAMTEAALHGTLIEMLAVRLPDRLAAGETARQRHARVGEEIKRQDQRDLPAAA